jgi:hypothetical protein
MGVPVALIQMISAFAIFAVGYLALMLAVLICFFIASCIYKGGCLARAYTVRSASLDNNLVVDDREFRPGLVPPTSLDSFRQQ